MSIQVTVKQVYGNDTIYPVCAKAKAFASLLGQKTFTHADIQKLKACGIILEVVAEKITL